MVACDDDSVVKRQLDVHELLNEKERTPQIPMKDLTVNKAVKDDENVGLTESRQTQTMKKGDKVHIQDITSSKI